MDIIAAAREEIETLNLTDTYRNKQFTKNFDKHISSLVDTTVKLAGERETVLSNTNFAITDQAYWDMEAYVLEKLDDVNNPNDLQALNNLEDFLYSKVIESLGNSFDNSSRLKLMIDNSVHDFLLSVKFKLFSNANEFFNPWEDAKNILLDNQVLFTFSTDKDKLNALGFNVRSDDSESIADKKINLVAKGRRSDYTYGYVRDLLALRNTVIEILDEYNSNDGNAMKTEEIIRRLRRMNLHETELSDSNIKNWLISPLKRYNRIGSHKEGYFLLKNCNDVAASYDSHFENFKGFFRTLENHRRLAAKFGCEDQRFEQHLHFFTNFRTIED